MEQITLELGFEFVLYGLSYGLLLAFIVWVITSLVELFISISKS